MELSELLERVNELPSPPSVAARINEETARESLTARSLAAVISHDVALVTKILKLANSAYYGLSRQVETIERAITVLGLDTIKSLAMAMSIAGFYRNDPAGCLDMPGLWNHSLACGIIARMLTRARHDQGLAEKAFICGIIHDIGIIAISSILPKEFTRIIQSVNNGEKRLSEAESAVLGFDHTQVGEAMARAWQFPEDHQRAIRRHHDSQSTVNDRADTREAALNIAVNIANKIGKIKNLGRAADPAHSSINHLSWEILQLEKDDLTDILEQAEITFAEMTKTWK